LTVFSRRQFGLTAGVALASIGLRIPAAAQASAAVPYVDPELAAALQAFQQKPLSINTDTVGWTERLVAGSCGAPDVRIYIRGSGKPGATRPAILHMHGGGYVSGSAKMWMPQLTKIAAALDCVVVTVDYRLAPATPYPGSLEDNYAALKWLHDNAADLGVDRTRIAVMGESAGGGHAAMLTIAAKSQFFSRR
jgi:acetyl esterase/lipase